MKTSKSGVAIYFVLIFLNFTCSSAPLGKAKWLFWSFLDLKSIKKQDEVDRCIRFLDSDSGNIFRKFQMIPVYGKFSAEVPKAQIYDIEKLSV